MSQEYKALVQKVVLDGRHGPYATADADQVNGLITFSLDKPVWQEDGVPEEGTYVILSDVRKKRAGWRAMSGRFVRPSDEIPTPQ